MGFYKVPPSPQPPPSSLWSLMLHHDMLRRHLISNAEWWQSFSLLLRPLLVCLHTHTHVLHHPTISSLKKNRGSDFFFCHRKTKKRGQAAAAAALHLQVVCDQMTTKKDIIIFGSTFGSFSSVVWDDDDRWQDDVIYRRRLLNFPLSSVHSLAQSVRKHRWTWSFYESWQEDFSSSVRFSFSFFIIIIFYSKVATTKQDDNRLIRRKEAKMPIQTRPLLFHSLVYTTVGVTARTWIIVLAVVWWWWPSVFLLRGHSSSSSSYRTKYKSQILSLSLDAKEEERMRLFLFLTSS